MPRSPTLSPSQISLVRKAAKVRRRLTNKALAERLNTTLSVVRHYIERAR